MRESDLKTEPNPACRMDTLSRVLIQTYCVNHDWALPADPESMGSDLRCVAALNSSQWDEFLELANCNHVVMRACAVLRRAATARGENDLARRCETSMTAEWARIERATGFLQRICTALESQGCKVAVIKSLDHWPDFGSDLDLYTTADQSLVEDVMCGDLDAFQMERSWGDRLANKWNYEVPGLPELVEIHVRFLGQTGEYERMACRVIERRAVKVVGGRQFYVPAPEERLLVSTLQRVYRHFYFRLCEMIDVAMLLRTEKVDFGELKRGADLAGIWPGVATFLCLIQSYIEAFGGALTLPPEVVASAHKTETGVRFQDHFLRMSKRSAARLYGAQLLQAGAHRDLRALMRLPLLPPLAVSALAAYRLTGSRKGIW
jgi:putative nucleotidyltransferase-like protein